MLYAVLRNGRTFGLFARAFIACHKSHFACSVSQIWASQPVSASRLVTAYVRFQNLNLVPIHILAGEPGA